MSGVDDYHRLLPQQEDYQKGKLPFQAQRALKAREVRAYLIAHPEGVTSTQVRVALNIDERHSNCLQWLQQRGAATFKKGADGVYRWFAADMSKKVEEEQKGAR